MGSGSGPILPSDGGSGRPAGVTGDGDVTEGRRAGTIGPMEAVADYEFAPLRIPPGTSRSAAATMLSLQADVGGWELARLQLHPDGTRKVVLRRRSRLSYLPRPVI
jgi:hypothetical protein